MHQFSTFLLLEGRRTKSKIISTQKSPSFHIQGALNAVKRVGHYAIPATTGALGGLAGSTMGGLAR